MAEPNAILSSDKSPAPTLALALLCALIIIELAAGIRGLWGGYDSKAVVAVLPAAAVSAPFVGLPVPAYPRAPGSLPPLVIPPIPTFTTPIPVGGGKSSTFKFSNPLPPPVTNAGLLPPAGQAPASPAPMAIFDRLPAARPATSSAFPSSRAVAPPPSSSTGSPQADDLLEVALQSRDLGDHEGALQALNRADLLVPNNPRIMREKALTLQRLGKGDEAKSLSAPAASSPRVFPDRPPQDAVPVQSPPSSSVSPRGMLNQSFGSRSPAPAPVVAAAPPVATVNGALSLGDCRIERDQTVAHGERFSLKVPLVAAAGEAIDPNQMILDVMFYDKVNDERIELTMADKPKFAYDTPGDFKNGREVLSVLYNLPEFTPREIAELGRHVFYGYVVKLYYKNRLMGATASPPDLSTMGESGQGKRI
ncbi:MAG: hypothetical protein JWO94_357 [Verrucomicrobiaceae bacterium]|nr:hypothetical protein [Verrucomicrobiaceae bacterium]